MSTLLKNAVLTETAIGDGDAAVGADDGGGGALRYLRVRRWQCTVGGEYVDGGALRFACSRSMKRSCGSAVLSETALGDVSAAIGGDDGGDGTLQSRRDRRWRCAVGDKHVINAVLRFCLQ